MSTTQARGTSDGEAADTRPATLTLTAGPTTMSPRVRSALSSPVAYHYDPAFLKTFHDLETQLAEIFCTKKDILIMQGEAVLGLEAAARSLVRPGMPVLNLIQGMFGRAMSAMLTKADADLHEITAPDNDAVDPRDVERYLIEYPEIELVVLVHCETPSGTCTDVQTIGPIVHAHGALTLIDCASSLAGMPLDTDKWHLDVCVAGPHKCLGGPPGLSLITVSEAAWEKIERNPTAPRGSFLSMLDWREQWLERRVFPHTPSVPLIHGLEAACAELLEEGLTGSFARHAQAADACRRGVRAMGLEVWPRTDEIAASSVTTIMLPDVVSDEQVRTHSYQRYGVLLSAGQGIGNLVKIGHMGITANTPFPVIGLASLGRTLADLGVRVNVAAGLSAALAALSQRTCQPVGAEISVSPTSRPIRPGPTFPHHGAG